MTDKAPYDVLVKGEPIRVRPMGHPGDRRFIVGNWVKTYVNRAKVPNAIFRAEHGRVVDKCIDEGTCLMVCKPSRESVLLGFAVGRTGRLDYVYLTYELRGQGVARRLIEEITGSTFGPCLATHRFAFRTAPSRFVFNPYQAGFYE